MSPSPPEYTVSPSRGSRAAPQLLALICPCCGSALTLHPGAAAYPCASCRRVYEPDGQSLRSVPLGYVDATSAIAPRGQVQLLPVWRFGARVDVRSKRAAHPAAPGYVWEQVRRSAAQAGDHSKVPSIFVPAFALERTVIARLGLRLLRVQPTLPLPEPASYSEGGSSRGRGDLLPILLSEADARIAAHFVYLALESDATPDLRAIDYELYLQDGVLLVIPADYDRRFVHDANWRLLLREFDGLLA